MIAAILLLIINILIFINTKEPEELTEVREKYQVLREHLKETNNEEFDMLYDEVPITAHYRISKGAVGYNSNKGHEIGLCIDGNVNEIFHVLLHELAHCTVEEYSHSKEYWEKFKKLRKISVELGIYEEIPEKTKFCNRYVQDK